MTTRLVETDADSSFMSPNSEEYPVENLSKLIRILN